MINYLFPILAVLAWGANTVVTKVSAGYLFPLEMSFARWVVAVVILTPFVATKIDRAYVRRHLRQIFILGVLGCVVYQSIAYFAAKFTTATNMGIIQSLIPLITLVLTMIFTAHRPKPLGYLGIVLSVVGVTIAVSHGDLRELVRQGVNFGDGLMLIAAAAFATYGFLVQRWRLQLPVIQSVYLQAVVATITLFPLYLLSPKHEPSVAGVSCVAFAGVAASVLAPLAWMQGIARLGAASVSLFFNLMPIVTAICAWAALSETLSISTAVGGLLTVGGVVLTELNK